MVSIAATHLCKVQHQLAGLPASLHKPAAVLLKSHLLARLLRHLQRLPLQALHVLRCSPACCCQLLLHLLDAAHCCLVLLLVRLKQHLLLADVLAQVSHLCSAERDGVAALRQHLWGQRRVEVRVTTLLSKVLS
jgi:hypothetical protein